MFSAEAHVGRGGGGVCIICSVCQVVIVACCFIPLFSIPESVPHSFVLFSSMPPFRENEKAQRHRLRCFESVRGPGCRGAGVHGQTLA